MMIEQSIAPWREDWFGARGSDAVRVEPVRLVSADAPFDLARAIRVSNLWWTPTRQASRLLATLALDVPAASAMHDGSPLTMLGERMTEELVRAMESVTAAASASPPRDGVLVRIVASCGTEIGSIFCPATLICERCTPASNASTKRGALLSRRQALASTEMSLEAHLGRTTLTLDQLLGLAIGDVLTLGRKLDEPVDLTVSDTVKPIASGQLGRTADRLSVQLQTFVVQQNA
jgi:flagellar motor switch/type III secretory pathway protein FliN